MWQTDFRSNNGQTYRVAIITDVTPSPDEWRLLSSQPVELITETVTPVADAVQATRCIVRLYCTETTNLDKLLRSATNTVRVLISRNGVPIWGGWLDLESAEIPEPYERGYRVELSFGDFAPLKLMRYEREGLIPIKDALAKMVGALCVPIKTDGAHLVASPAAQYVDTGLLEEDATKYDLLELVCKTTCSTVRQYGAIRLDSPLRRSQLKSVHIRHTYGDNNYTALGRIYNTINYTLKGETKRESTGEAVDLTGIESSGAGDVTYKTGAITNSDHTFTAVATAQAGIAYNNGADTPMKYGVLVKDSKQYKTWLPKTYGYTSTPSRGNKVLEQLSEPLGVGSETVNISVYAHITQPTWGRDRMEHIRKMRSSDSVDMYLAIPAVITLEYKSGKRLTYNGKTFAEGSNVTPLLYRRGGFSEGPQNCSTHADSVAALDKPDNGTYQGEPEGITLALPSGDLSNCRIRVEVYDGVYFVIPSLFGSNSFADAGLNYDYNRYRRTGVYTLQHIYANLLEYRRFLREHDGALNGPPGGIALQRVTITEQLPGGEQELNVQAYITPEVTEELSYNALASTWAKLPAWTYTRAGEELKRVESISGKAHWELIIEALYTLYGERGKQAQLSTDIEPTEQVYTYGGTAWWLTGARTLLREGRTEVELQELSDIEWYGKAQI